MLTSVTLQNFFSFCSKASVPLSPAMNVLVGINGSGKSNFIKALRLLYEGISGDGLRNLIQLEWGGYDQITHARAGSTGVISLTFRFRPRLDNSTQNNGHSPVYAIRLQPQADGTFTVSERITFSQTNGTEELFFESRAGEGLIRNPGGGLVSLTPETGNRAEPARMELRFRALPPESMHPMLVSLRQAIRQFSFYGFFNTSYSSRARLPALPAGHYGERLAFDGRNMSQVLHSIRGYHPDVFQELVSFLRRISPNLRELLFSESKRGVSLRLLEKNLNHSVSVRHISDGTLRYLLYLAIFLNPARGLAVCLDEPESGLHPDMLHTLSEAMTHAVQDGTQLIIATHSPLLLNSFELDDLLVFDKSPENETLVKTVNGDDLSEITGLSLPGQLWLSGYLGGKRW
ncbi:putative ATPase [Cyclonatronum proteinivorum]|uniref:Putative ATPase n=1 Tax=Cyclonatronum proteinivorum TaxID=1457365 RepID=A0A345UHE5_9BACT|nr:AAA family ATPase [Cyclonatronum proteinivorum]AXI99896.1 putative ATPase [Cyclonatronum proteinivorum]